MPQKIIIAEEERIAALLTDGQVDKLIVAQGRYQIGDVYLGTIENVLPGIDAAFVNIGANEKNGFIHVTDLGPLRIKQSAASITELLRPSQKVLVQVMKEPTGNKGPRLTGNIALPGRYLVLQPNGQGVSISRRINAENERNRLRALGVLIKPPGTGLLIRSEAEAIAEELIIEDLENLLSKNEVIQQAADRANPPTLLNRDEDFIHRVLRDHINAELNEIIVETPQAIERAKRFLSEDNSNVIVECHRDSNSLISHYKIDSAIFNALKPRVDLPSGGYIIIEPTEALTVIDVNSGSFTRSANSRETVLWTNCEAAIEIARQLQLRNIGGVIIIDFIDMESRRDQLQLLEYFTAAIKDDSSRPQIAQLTELGLVELTRKRQGQNIYELFSKECQNCSGLGHVPNINGKHQLQSLNQNVINKKVNLNSDNNTQSNNKINENTIEINEISTPLNKVTSKDSNGEGNLTKQTQENISMEIEMNEEEEYVYSSLGLNPTLLLENEAIYQNITVQLIRPGKSNNDLRDSLENKEEVNSDNTNLENKDTLMKSTLKGNSKDINHKDVAETSQTQNEINSESKHKEGVSNGLSESDKLTVEDQTNSSQSEDEIDDHRRRRRRSSAAN